MLEEYVVFEERGNPPNITQLRTNFSAFSTTPTVSDEDITLPLPQGLMAAASKGTHEFNGTMSIMRLGRVWRDPVAARYEGIMQLVLRPETINTLISHATYLYNRGFQEKLLFDQAMEEIRRFEKRLQKELSAPDAKFELNNPRVGEHLDFQDQEVGITAVGGVEWNFGFGKGTKTIGAAITGSVELTRTFQFVSSKVEAYNNYQSETDRQQDTRYKYFKTHPDSQGAQFSEFKLFGKLHGTFPPNTTFKMNNIFLEIYWQRVSPARAAGHKG